MLECLHLRVLLDDKYKQKVRHVRNADARPAERARGTPPAGQHPARRRAREPFPGAGVRRVCAHGSRDFRRAPHLPAGPRCKTCRVRFR